MLCPYVVSPLITLAAYIAESAKHRYGVCLSLQQRSSICVDATSVRLGPSVRGPARLRY